MTYEASQLLDLKRRHHTLVIISICLALSNSLLVAFCGYSTLHRQIEITPFAGQGQYIKSDVTIDNHYLIQMAENFITTRFNVTPATVKQKHQHLLKYVTDKAYSPFNQLLVKEQEVIIKQQISSHFAIAYIKPDLLAKEVKVKGVLYRYIDKRALPPRHRIYVLRYRYHWGRLKLEYFGKEDVAGVEQV